LFFKLSIFIYLKNFSIVSPTLAFGNSILLIKIFDQTSLKMKNFTSFKQHFLLLLILYFGLFNVYAQKTISGKVTEAGLETGIPGVNILVKGTTNGTTTDFDGNYLISVPEDEGVLIFSYIGYTTQEIAIGNQSLINVELEIDITQLGEIVVVGYGTQKKERKPFWCSRSNHY